MNTLKPNKLKLLTILTLSTLMVLPATGAYASDRLQEKANEILQSEPGATQVTVKEEVAPIPTDKDVVNFMDFDLNRDGTLSRDEVGEKLYKIFDRDGNEVIDNIEMKRRSIMVFTPMSKKTIEIIDYQSAAKPEKRIVTEEEFLEASQLIKFDKDKDGLSPLDFLGMPFNQVDVHTDKVIDLYEWKRAYAKSVKPLHEEQFYYNG